jgi:hypothetical protein
LNNLSIKEIFEITLVEDTNIVGQNQNASMYLRGGKCIRGEPARCLTPEKDLLNQCNVASNSRSRRFFETKLQCNHGQGLVGLGPRECRAGDQVWTLKGGKVLYTLRTGRVKGDHVLGTLNLVDCEYRDEQYSENNLIYEFIGESFILTLMDGEILDMVGEAPKRPRPSPLHEMDRIPRYQLGLVYIVAHQP